MKKTIRKANVWIAAFTLALFLSTSLQAAPADGGKTVEKARQAVENAEPGDWKTLLSSAKKCVRKGVNLEEAQEWIEQALAMEKTTKAYDLLGDLHVKLGDEETAMQHYLKSMDMHIQHGTDAAETQKRIGKL